MLAEKKLNPFTKVTVSIITNQIYLIFYDSIIVLASLCVGLFTEMVWNAVKCEEKSLNPFCNE